MRAGCDLHSACKSNGVPVLLDKLIERPRDKHHEVRRHARGYKILAVLSLIALILQTTMLMVSLFEPPLPYTIANPGPEPVDSPEFVRMLSAITGGGSYGHNRVDVLTNGNIFYAAELESIRAAKHYVFIECYIIQKGRLADEL